MQNPIELSICINQNQEIHYLEEQLRQHSAKIQLKTLAWENEWKEFTNYAVYHMGPDVSHVGSPLVGDLVSMNALRPFTVRDLVNLGGVEAFEPVAWQSSRRAEHELIWAIPWTADPRVLFYWRDMLEEARVNESDAFQNLDAIEATLERLQAQGYIEPWVIPNAMTLPNLQVASSWVWAAGGDFVNENGKRTLFFAPQAMEGWLRFFRLFRFMPQSRTLNDQETLQLFANRKAAATVGSLYFGTQILELISVQDRSKLGITLPPGPPLVGGSSLVVWGYTKYEREALDLVQYLTSPHMQAEHCRRTGYLPTRLDVLSQPPFSTDYRFKAYTQALRSGKPFPLIKAGGLLENNLSLALVNIWHEILMNHGKEIQDTIEALLQPLARRLDITLSQF